MKKTITTIISLFMFHHLLAPDNNIIMVERRELKEDFLIADTFKHIESRGNYSAIGASGEYGAYQFMPLTWKYWSMKYFNKLLRPIPESQDSVAFRRINEWIDQGLTYKEIASYWNSGSPSWHNKVGVNKHGVMYDVPAYVNKFTEIYNRLKENKKYWRISFVSVNCPKLSRQIVWMEI